MIADFINTCHVERNLHFLAPSDTSHHPKYSLKTFEEIKKKANLLLFLWK